MTTAQDPNEVFEVFSPPVSEGLVEEIAVRSIKEAVTRSEVHRLGLWHRCIGIWIFNSLGQVLLQKRSLSKDTFPGRWDISVGGHMDGLNADPLSTALREAEEELGLQLNPDHLERICILAKTNSGTTISGKEFIDREFKYIYAYQLPDDSVITPFEAEVAAVKWESAPVALSSERDEDFVPRAKEELSLVQAHIAKKLNRTSP
jgi:isopentenyl-diphosphate delta-isomerase